MIIFEYHDAPASGHLGREKTFLSVSRDLYWSNQYKWVRKYVAACEVCQRVKPSPSSTGSSAVAPDSGRVLAVGLDGLHLWASG